MYFAGVMVAFMSVVRFKVRPEQTEAFVSTWSNGPPAPGRVSLRLIQTGDCQFCGVSEWESEDAIAAARPDLIKFLDTIRPMLEEISPVQSLQSASLSVPIEKTGYTKVYPA